MKKLFSHALIWLSIAMILSFYFGFIELGCILVFIVLTMLNAVGKVASIDNKIRTHNPDGHTDYDRYTR